ncbi:MAG: bile acid:sodium symporter family protein [Arenimonas sp.]
MADNPLIMLFLPICLGIIMIGLGLHLTVADFRRVLTQPKAVAVALFVQLIVLPPTCFLIARVFNLPAELGLGLLLLAASPGGITANLFSHLARGDVALNITLTAINSLLALISLPFWVVTGMAHFLAAENNVPPPTSKVIEVALLVIVPVLIGMSVRRFKPALADAAEKPVRLLSTLVLAILTLLAIVSEWELLVTYAPIIGLACLTFNLLSLATGYWSALSIKLAKPQATAIAFEIGVHNATLSIFVALHVLKMSAVAIAPAIYSLIMYVTAAAFAFWLLKNAKNPHDQTV